MFTLVLALAPALVITTPSPDWREPSVGRPWSLTLSAEGGTAPYRWSILEGALPPGIHLVDLSTVMLGSAPQAGLFGAPAEAGRWQVRLQVTDAEGREADGWLAVAVSPLSLRQVDVNAPVGQALEWQAVAADGAAPFVFQLAPAGYLPLGLMLTSDGKLLGAAVVPGHYGVPVQVTDAGLNTLRTTLTVTVYGAESSLPAAGVRTNVEACRLMAALTPLPEHVQVQVSGGTWDWPLEIVLTNRRSGEQAIARYEDQSRSLEAHCRASSSTLSLGMPLGLW